MAGKSRRALCLVLVLLSLPFLRVEGQVPSGSSLDIWEGIRGSHAYPTKDARLTFYLPGDGRRDHPMIIVCPGGSYHWLDRENEGVRVARWLCENGIAAAVLEYRVAGVRDFMFHDRWIRRGNIHPDMIADLQRSIQIARRNCSILGIDPERIGAMGFSAGGHLVASAAELSETVFPSLYGCTDTTSVSPDFVAPIYPVVTLVREDIVHKRSRRGLLGERRQNDRAMRDSLSLERHVDRIGVPVFLLNCKDDPIVDYRNSIVLDSALTAGNIPHRYILYEKGGHGFGAAQEKFSPETSHWQEEFLSWLRGIGILKGRE